MYWLMVVIVAVVVFGVAAVAAGRGGTLAPPEHDRPPAPALPATGQLAAADLAGLRFPPAVRGYRMADVDAVLERLGRELDERDARIAELETRLADTRAEVQELRRR